MSAGIDYGAGQVNIDRQTGIRYGVISQGAVLQAWADAAEPDYGKPTCPKCGNELQEPTNIADDIDDYEQGPGCADFACALCRCTFDSQDAFGEEPIGWNYADEGYELTDCLNSDIFVIKSPFYTFARFCSPCVPGAGNLEASDPDGGVKTYCLGHDWFESGEAPYPVYSVETGQRLTKS
jgi:hypothetical protein